jgi:hypothetical protein
MTTKRVTIGATGLVLVILMACSQNQAGGPTSRTGTADSAATQTTPAGQTGLRSEIVFTRTGGFVGTNDRIAIQPDGTFQTSGRMLGARSGKVSPAQLAALADALRTWPLTPGQPPGVAADAFQFTVTYAGQTVSWSEAATNVPEALRALPGLILNAVTGAADAQPPG